MAQDERKTELAAELARQRTAITGHVHLLGHDLDFPAKARRAFARHPAVWIGAAALIGLFIARIPLRRKVVVTPRRKTEEPVIEKAGKAGLVLGALKIAFDIARPTLTRIATQYVAEYFERAANRDQYRR